MNKGASVPEVVYGVGRDAGQAPLPLASEGVQRIVWHGRYGDMLIEVREGAAWVNGERVECLAGDAEPSDTTTTRGGNRP